MSSYKFYRDFLGLSEVGLLKDLQVGSSITTDKGYKLVCTGITDYFGEDVYEHYDMEFDAIHLEDESLSEYGLSETWTKLEHGEWILIDEWQSWVNEFVERKVNENNKISRENIRSWSNH